ncbi:MAG: Ribosomal RNA small subunit methyltransferase G [Phycisphaerae bacterium]|nr:Ribosomal RNA small subunit methyltransferase G [Phycisphaerae bacterium]
MNFRELFLQQLQAGAQAWQLELSPAQREQMWSHFTLLQQANQRHNLTRITDPVAAAWQHYLDSLAVVAWAVVHSRPVQRVLDIGTGGGFPALPVAIARPDWQVMAIDGTGKKITCVQEFISALQLANCLALQQRAESWSPAERFDLILMRAVKPLEEALLLAHHLLNPKGVLAIYKTDPLPADEQSQGLAAARRLRLTTLSSWSYQLHQTDVPILRQLCLFEAAAK